MHGGPVLIVEDNPDDELLILRALKKHNFSNPVTVVRDGAEALDYLFATGVYEGQDVARPSVVLLDLKLPKISGLEVLERLRADPRTETIPVVVLTSSDEEPDLERSYALHVNSYVRKPVEFSKFAEAVSKLGLYWLLVNEPPPDRKGGDHE